jgi:hypothetical protein
VDEVRANGSNPLILRYPFGAFNLSAIINDASTGGRNITDAEYFVDAIGTTGTGTSMAPTDATWNSSVEIIQATVDVGDWDFGESHTYHVHGFDGVAWSACANVTVTKPDLDFIDIMDAPDNESTPIPDQNVLAWEYLTGHAAGFNDTYEYLGAVNATWEIENHDDASAIIYTTYGEECMLYTGTGDGTANWTATFLWDGILYTDNIGLTVDGTPPSVVSTMPLSGSVEVPLNTSIRITFSELMDEQSVEDAVTVQPTINVSGFGWAGPVLTVSPSGYLSFSTTYTVMIGTNATDVIGLPLASAFSFNFTTLLDTDGDGIPDSQDPDDDNDGVPDDEDDFPTDPTENTDTDGDGIGDNADDDDDGDDVPDNEDAFPLDPGESLDTDGDGIGNNADEDDDGDGVPDEDDPEPFNPEVSGQAGLGQYWWVAVIIALVLVACVLTFLRFRKGHDNGEEPDTDSEDPVEQHKT